MDIETKVKGILITLLTNDDNFFMKMRNIFNKIYTEIISLLKNKLMDLFFAKNFPSSENNE